MIDDPRYNAKVVSVHKIHETLAVFRIKLDKPIAPCTPGQFATVGLLGKSPGVEPCRFENEEAKGNILFRRAYSISHPLLDPMTQSLIGKDAPFFTSEIEFYITLVRPQSSEDRLPLLTPRMYALKPESRLFVGAITGKYVLSEKEVEAKKQIVFAATGTGEAPHNAMIWKLLSDGYQGKIVSMVCNRTLNDFAYHKVHMELARQFTHYTYMPLVTREQGEKKTYIQDAILSGALEEVLGQPLSPEHQSFYLCGNPLMIGAPRLIEDELVFEPGTKGVTKLLMERGFTPEMTDRPGEIHFEKYW